MEYDVTGKHFNCAPESPSSHLDMTPMQLHSPSDRAAHFGNQIRSHSYYCLVPCGSQGSDGGILECVLVFHLGNRSLHIGCQPGAEIFFLPLMACVPPTVDHFTDFSSFLLT